MPIDDGFFLHGTDMGIIVAIYSQQDHNGSGTLLCPGIPEVVPIGFDVSYQYAGESYRIGVLPGFELPGILIDEGKFRQLFRNVSEHE